MYGARHAVLSCIHVSAWRGIVAYLVLAIALQLGSAWLLTPAVSGKDTARFWRRYAGRVAFLLAACLVVAVLVVVTVMALLDSGTI